MTLFDLIMTAIALSMDAFAVSIGKGLSTPNIRLKHGLICGAYFGGFQALMASCWQARSPTISRPMTTGSPSRSLRSSARI